MISNIIILCNITCPSINNLNTDSILINRVGILFMVFFYQVLFIKIMNLKVSKNNNEKVNK